MEWSCRSTHGGAGYASGSYWKDDKVICALCKTEISNPQPTGGHRVETSKPKGFVAGLRWLLGYGRYVRVPDWTPVIGDPPKELIDRLTKAY